MRLLIFPLLCLSLITSFISASSIKNIISNFASFILQSILCFYALLISNFLFIYVVFGTTNLSGIISGQHVIYTPDDFCLFALWFLFQVVICVAVVIGTRLIDCHKKGIGIRLFSKRQEHGLCALLFISFVFIGVTVSLKSWSETQLLINEIRSISEVIEDKDDEDDENEEDKNSELELTWELTGDYIELYNPTPFNIKLSHFYVTDDLNEQPKQAGNDDVILAGDYAVVWTEEGDNNFTINNDGNEVIYLLNSSKTVIDSVTVPKLKRGTTYARNDSESGWGIYEPSPMQGNDGDEIKYVPDPIFSAESGFYDEPFTLKINAPDGCRIYYTIDSSIPDENSILYEDGIQIMNASDNPNVVNAIQNVKTVWLTYNPPVDPVDKATVIRAIAVDGDNNRSDVITKTYFIDLNQYKDRYVISLISDVDDLFGEDGIFVTGPAYDEWYLGDQDESAPATNFSKRGVDYEVETYMEMFHDNLLMSQGAGLRVQGDSSRDRARKGVKIYSRKRYSGNYYFDYNIFDQPIHSFTVRNGNGNDGFTDSFVQSLVQDRGIGGKQSIPVSVFLNGEYWYDYYLIETYSEDYIAQKFNLEASEITLVTSMPKEITNFLDEHDLSNNEDYLLFGELVDIQNYIDFMVDNIYVCNMDLSETKNQKIWRTEGNTGIGYDDGKWRFLTHDMDAIAWNNNSNYYGIESYEINSFSVDHQYAGVAFDQETVFSALLKNEDFCRQFVLTFMDFVNTYFQKDNVEKQLIEWGKDITWCDSFFERRFDYIIPDLAEEFNLTGTLEEITLKIDQTDSGTITVNTVTPDLSEGEWSGYYYTDYPVTICAIPSEGYKFAGWKHDGEIYEDPIIEVELTEDNNVWEAEFVKEE